MQSLLQSIDAKVSGNAPAGGARQGAPLPPGTPGAPPTIRRAAGGPGPGPNSSAPSGMPPISADTLYQNALRDFTSGKYDLSRQEFSDYIKNFPTNDLASNAQFYLGEIFLRAERFQQCDRILRHRADELSAELQTGGFAVQESDGRTGAGFESFAVRDLREVERRFPGSDEARRAQAKLREIGATAPRTTAPRQ